GWRGPAALSGALRPTRCKAAGGGPAWLPALTLPPIPGASRLARRTSTGEQPDLPTGSDRNRRTDTNSPATPATTGRAQASPGTSTNKPPRLRQRASHLQYGSRRRAGARETKSGLHKAGRRGPIAGRIEASKPSRPPPRWAPAAGVTPPVGCRDPPGPCRSPRNGRWPG